MQTIVHQLRKGRKPDCVKQSEKDSLITHYLLALHDYKKQLLKLSNIIVADAFFSNYDLNFSIADLKLLMHNAMMIERFLSMFGNLPNVHKNQGLKEHYFKDLLLYGLKASA